MAFDKAAAKYVPDLKVLTFKAPENWQIIAPDLGRSDHAPFWISNYPAVMLTGTADYRNPNYHLPSDTLGSLNFNFMANVVKATIATLTEEAIIHNSNFVEDSVNITVSSIEKVSSCNLELLTNPATNTLSFKLSNCNTNNSYIDIYDLNGKLILEKEIFQFEKNIELNIKDWKDGIYILKSKTGLFSKKFLVKN